VSLTTKGPAKRVGQTAGTARERSSAARRRFRLVASQRMGAAAEVVFRVEVFALFWLMRVCTAFLLS
jgi:hypothetical protein